MLVLEYLLFHFGHGHDGSFAGAPVGIPAGDRKATKLITPALYFHRLSGSNPRKHASWPSRNSYTAHELPSAGIYLPMQC